MATVTVCCNDGPPCGSQEKPGVADTWQVRAVTWRGGRSSEKTVFTSPARWRIQCSSEEVATRYHERNRAGNRDIKADAAQRHGAEKQLDGRAITAETPTRESGGYLWSIRSCGDAYLRRSLSERPMR